MNQAVLHVRNFASRLRKVGLPAAVGAVVVSLTACSNTFSCPSESDNVSLSSYGRFKIGDAGPDATARNCVSHCNWHVFQGSDGGVGNTLQIASPSEDIVFVWAYNDLAGYRVKQGWTGQTDKGVRLGDTITDFQMKYPGLTAYGRSYLFGQSDGVELQAYFDQNGQLTEMLVGGYIQP